MYVTVAIPLTTVAFSTPPSSFINVLPLILKLTIPPSTTWESSVTNTVKVTVSWTTISSGRDNIVIVACLLLTVNVALVSLSV
ncbi:MAG: hypothetical protein LUG89_01210 [Methanosphaera sp.]|nr:hypothetical protein [Methanosphaera sp.]